jgi:ankyrin repeat protein
MTQVSFFRRVYYLGILQLAIVVVVTLAMSRPASCGEIHNAARRGDVDKVQALIRRDPNLVLSTDHKEMTPLHVAAESGQMKVVTLLLDANAYINVRDGNGHTPLFLAATAGHTDVVMQLLARGADVNIQDDLGKTLLHWVAGAGDKNLANLLLGRGARVNALTKDNRTPLFFAAAEGQKKMVELLLAHDADASIVDRWGDTPSYAAAAHGHGEVAELLRQYHGPLPTPVPPASSFPPASAMAISAESATTTVLTISNLCDDEAQRGECQTAFARAQIEKLVQALYGDRPGQPPITPQFRRQAATQLVRNMILAREAERNGLEHTPEAQELLRWVRLQVLAEEERRWLQRRSEPTPEELESYYEEGKPAKLLDDQKKSEIRNKLLLQKLKNESGALENSVHASYSPEYFEAKGTVDAQAAVVTIDGLCDGKAGRGTCQTVFTRSQLDDLVKAMTGNAPGHRLITAAESRTVATTLVHNLIFSKEAEKHGLEGTPEALELFHWVRLQVLAEEERRWVQKKNAPTVVEDLKPEVRDKLAAENAKKELDALENSSPASYSQDYFGPPIQADTSHVTTGAHH